MRLMERSVNSVGAVVLRIARAAEEVAIGAEEEWAGVLLTCCVPRRLRTMTRSTLSATRSVETRRLKKTSGCKDWPLGQAQVRGCGEGRASRLLRASSSSWSRWRLERRGRREDRIFFLCVRTKSAHLPNEAVFPMDRVRLVIFQTIARQRREAGTRPRSPRFKWRAGTPHPPLHQPSGAESTTTNGSTSALVCELRRSRHSTVDTTRDKDRLKVAL